MYQVQLQGEYAMAPQHKAFKKKPTKKTKAQKRAEAAARVQKVQPTTNVSEKDCFYYTCTLSHDTCTHTYTHTHTHTKQVEDLEVAAVLPESCHSKLQPQMKPAAYKKVKIENKRVSSTRFLVLFIS